MASKSRRLRHPGASGEFPKDFSWKNRRGCVIISPMQRFLVFLGVLAAAPALLADGGPAHMAINAAQKVTKPPAALVEMTGERGEPRPQEWKLVYSDPSARGGVREILASGDVVISERTPLRGFPGIASSQPISLTRLKIDSDGAFDIANRQASARRIGFNWVDYTLRANTVTGAPMWILRLYDNMGAQVGVVQISAEDGSILMPLSPEGNVRYEEDDGESAVQQKIGGVIGTVGGTVERTAIKVKDSTLRAVGTVQEVLTGERTIGPQGED